MLLLVLILCLLFAFGGLPHWGYHQWGYAPSGIGFVIVIVLIVLLLSGRF